MTEPHSIEPLECPICHWKGGCRICYPRARCPNCGNAIIPLELHRVMKQVIDDEKEDWY